jgi:LysM repeat protein
MDINKFRQVVYTFEGSKREPYVPMEGGKPLDNSGVTIGKGVDLGQQTPEKLAEIGVDRATIELLRPFFGLKGRDAVAALKAAQDAGMTVRLTDPQLANLDNSVLKGYAGSFQKEFERKVGFSFDELNENQQMALTSLAFQYGNDGVLGTDDKPTNLTKQLKARDMEAAAGNIATWNNKYRTRNNATALLFQGAAGADQMEEAKRYVQDPAIRKTLAQGQLPEELTAPFVVGEPEGIIGIPFERPAPLSREASVYTVRQGDTLSDIAQRAGRSLQNLITYNKDAGLVDNPDKIYTGQDLLIPPTEVKLDEDAFANEFMSYRPEYM